jgi:hypothetical protein
MSTVSEKRIEAGKYQVLPLETWREGVLDDKGVVLNFGNI